MGHKYVADAIHDTAGAYDFLHLKGDVLKFYR
jgi:hypothetical protein